MPTADYISITAFARLCQVSAKTLRFYADIGLFRPALVDARTRYRFYRHEQLREFAHIQSIRSCGASLAEIRAAVRTGARTDAEQKTFLEKLRNAKLAALDEARRSLSWIEAALEDLELEHPLHATITFCASVKVASIRTDVDRYEDIQQHETRLMQAVHPVPLGRMQGVLWHRCADAGILEGEPFVEVGPQMRRRAPFQIRELRGAHVARAFSSLDDDEAEETYVGLSRWIRARGYRLASARREIYRGTLLEIQYPIEAA